MKRLITRLATLGSILAVLALGVGCGTPQTPTDTKTDNTTDTTTDNANTSTSSLIDLQITPRNLEILQGFDNTTKAYESDGSYRRLLWTNYGQTLVVRNSDTNLLPAQLTGKPGVYTRTKDCGGNFPGECVSLAKALSDSSVNTDNWTKGRSVIQSSIAPGTVIATFSGDKPAYKSGEDHTAILKGPSDNGFEVWDQNWMFEGVVGTHTISAGGSGVTDADKYYVVQVNSTTTYAGDAIRYGQLVATSIAKSGDYQDRKFTGQAGDIITIHMVQNGGASLSPYVALWDPSGKKVSEGYGDAGYTEAWIKNYKLAFSGTYTIRTGGCNGTVGGFKLSLVH